MALNLLLSEGYNLCSSNFLFTYLFSGGSNTTDSAAPTFPPKLSLEKVKATVIFTFQVWNTSSKIKEKTENRKNALYLYAVINLSVKVTRVMREEKVPVDRCDLAFISYIFI